MLNKFVTNFARTCFHHWTASKAIMEFVQNFLDSDGERDYDIAGDTITLTNKNIKVSNKLLMMGKSDKRNDPTKRGQFGVGSIQAMVVLTDLNISVVIHNNDVVWTPSWEHSEQFDEDILVIHENRADNPNNNFTVTISGLSELDVEEVIKRSIIFQERKVLYTSEVYGDVIETLNDERGEVYVGDIYVCQNQAFNYSYNFKPKVLKLSQDRDAASQWDLQELTAKLIIDTGDSDFIQDSIMANKLDTNNINQYGWEPSKKTPNEVDDNLAVSFLKEHGVAVVTADYYEQQENEKLGNKSVYIQNSSHVKAIQSSKIYKDAISELDIVDRVSFSDLITKTLDDLEYLVQNGTALNKLDHDELIKDLEEVRTRIYDDNFS